MPCQAAIDLQNKIHLNPRRDLDRDYIAHVQRCQDCQEHYRTLTAWARENEKYWTPERIRQLEIDDEHHME